jgi:hypothetical protein
MNSTVEPSLCVARQSSQRLGLEISLGGVSAQETSAVWTVAGWKIQFIRLQPDQTIALDQSQGSVYLKLICGGLVDPELTPFGALKEARNTLVADSQVKAEGLGAIFALFTETNAVPDNLHRMDQLAFDGPEASVFEWQSFYQRFDGRIEFFKDVEAYIVPGFHLLDADGAEIAYVHFWTVGKGADASTHDHSQNPSVLSPAFAEIHWVFNNGTGLGGMYECDAIGAERTRTVIQRGEEHGPFWRVDPAAGLPKTRPNGAVEYGLHGWQGGTDGDDNQAFDFVAAFEINPDHASVKPNSR